MKILEEKAIRILEQVRDFISELIIALRNDDKEKINSVKNKINVTAAEIKALEDEAEKLKREIEEEE